MSKRALTSVMAKAAYLAVPTMWISSLFAAQTNVVAVTNGASTDDVPAIVSRGSDLGQVSADKPIKITVWLKMHNQAAFDLAVEQLYTAGSPSYHQWMSEADLAKYSPTPAEVQIVKAELEAHGLSVEADESGLALRASGQAANVEAAFHTQLRTFALNGSIMQANATKAALAGPAGALVETVSGLANSSKQPMLVRPRDPETGLAKAPVPLVQPAANSGFGAYITNQCFQTPTAFKFTTQGADLPIAVYFGNLYDPGPGVGCGYGPKQLASVYGVDAAAKLGLTGEGQTVVIVDAFGSPTIDADANLFSAIAGLPALTPSNFQIVYPSGPPVVDLTSKNQQGWAEEVALDVEWVHALAPQAKIVLVAALTNNDDDLQYAIQYATTHRLGSIMSNSYGGGESDALVSNSVVKRYNTLVKRAAAAGIAFNAATGDSGDTVAADSLVTVSSPADSPYATAVGGTSLNVPTTNGLKTTGWGTDLTRITSATGVYDPPVFLGFIGGAGGGESSIFSKPAYQKALPGSGRQQPDVSATADPYLGVPIVYTNFSNSKQYLSTIGGTSVATPVFSAIWALADQLAGTSLGQAAPIVAQLSSKALLDVVPVTSPTNVFGAIIDSTGYTQYAPTDVVLPVPEPKFVSAFYPVYSGGIPSRYDVLSFGTDSSLRIEKGWDNVTGYGTPAGLAFIKEAATYK